MGVNDRTEPASEDLTTAPEPSAPFGRAADQVTAALETLLETLGPGGRVPPHTELMRLYGASERAVREALDQMQRQGRIRRHRGRGTFVAPEKPDSEKRSLSTSPPLVSDRTIIAIAPTDHSFFDRCLDLLCIYSETHGLSLICKPIGSRFTPATRHLLEDSHFLTLAHSGPVGFVFLNYMLHPLAEHLQREGARVALVGTPPIGAVPTVPCIYGDHEHGAQLVVRHLLELGHRRLAFVSLLEDLPQRLRWRGHLRALEEAAGQGIPVEHRVMRREFFHWRENPEQAAVDLRLPDAPTGLICWNDHEAAQLLALLTRAGVRVPEEVSLVGYDNLPESRLVYPPLTTVEQSMAQQVRAAVDCLTRPEIGPLAHTIVVPTLVPGESTGPPRGHSP